MPMFELSDKPKQPTSNDILILACSTNNVLYDETCNSVFFTPGRLSLDLATLKGKFVYVGKMDEQEIYAIDLSGFKQEGLSFVKPFGVLDTLDEQWLKPFYRSFQLLHWHKNSQHCGCCGNETSCSEKEFAKSCGSCKLRFYPQYSPAIIVRITRGNDEILLGRSAYFRPGVYSTLAGFIEAGETPEEAVRREVREEVGIEVDGIKLHSIQPWPFPNSLMIGFTAQYKSGELTIDKKELEDARWFRADALPRLPTHRSIAYKLITEFTNHSPVNIYPKRSVTQTAVDAASAAGGAFGLMNAVKAIHARYSILSKPAWGPYALASFRMSYRLASGAIILSTFARIAPQIPNPYRYQYPLLTHPILMSYTAGALFGTIEMGATAALASSKVLQQGKFNFKQVHAQGALTCAALGVYPMAKHYFAYRHEASSTWVAGGITAVFYGMLMMPLAAFDHWRNKAVPKPSYKGIMRQCLWKMPAVGLTGAICHQLAERNFQLTK